MNLLNHENHVGDGATPTAHGVQRRMVSVVNFFVFLKKKVIEKQ